MSTVTAEIDVTRPVGRKLVRELEEKNYVHINYPFIGNTKGKTYSLQEIFKRGEDFLNNYYGTDIKLKY